MFRVVGFARRHEDGRDGRPSMSKACKREARTKTFALVRPTDGHPTLLGPFSAFGLHVCACVYELELELELRSRFRMALSLVRALSQLSTEH